MNDEDPSDSENSLDTRVQANNNGSAPRLQPARPSGNVQRLHPARPSENFLRLQPARPSENTPRLQPARPSENTTRLQVARPSENVQRPQVVRPSENVLRPQSGQPTENAPRLQPARPSENVPPEISIYDCNSEEEDEAVPPPPSRKRAALSPLKPLNPTVSKTLESNQPTKAKAKYMGSGPSGLSVRQDSVVGSKDSPEQTENNEIYYVFNQKLLQLCDQVPKIPKRVSPLYL